MIRAWYYNVWCKRQWFRTGEWKYYYCSLWCFLTDQHLCRKPSRQMDDTRLCSDCDDVAEYMLRAFDEPIYLCEAHAIETLMESNCDQPDFDKYSAMAALDAMQDDENPEMVKL